MKKINRLKIATVENLLCDAMEGGSNYWYCITGLTAPKNLNNSTADFKEYKRYSYPLNTSGAVEIEDMEGGEGKKYTLNLKAIREGIEVMRDKFPHHYANAISENDDAETGDVFLQCCLFKDVIYG